MLSTKYLMGTVLEVKVVNTNYAFKIVLSTPDQHCNIP